MQSIKFAMKGKLVPHNTYKYYVDLDLTVSMHVYVHFRGQRYVCQILPPASAVEVIALLV